MPARATMKLAADKKSAEVYIYSDIGAYYGGVTSQEFIEDLQRLGPVDKIVVRIASTGGIVFEAVAIFNALERHPAEIEVAIDAMAASAASLIAMSGNKIVIAANARMMIHRPWNIAIGTADELRKTADQLDELDKMIVGIYANRTGLDREKISAMMDEETWMNAEQAKDLGFADEIGNENTAAAMTFDLSRFKHPPADLVARPPAGEMAKLQAAADSAAEVAVRLRLLDIDDDEA